MRVGSAPAPLYSRPLCSAAAPQPLREAAVLANQLHVVTRDRGGAIAVWDVTTGAVVHRLSGVATLADALTALFQPQAVPPWFSVSVESGACPQHLDAATDALLQRQRPVQCASAGCFHQRWKDARMNSKPPAAAPFKSQLQCHVQHCGDQHATLRLKCACYIALQVCLGQILHNAAGIGNRSRLRLCAIVSSVMLRCFCAGFGTTQSISQSFTCIEQGDLLSLLRSSARRAGSICCGLLRQGCWR